MTEKIGVHAPTGFYVIETESGEDNRLAIRMYEYVPVARKFNGALQSLALVCNIDDVPHIPRFHYK